MNVIEYREIWNAVHPLMLTKMQNITDILRPQLPLNLHVTTPSVEECCDEFKVAADIKSGDITVIALDFTLMDSDEADGVGIALNLTGYNALVLGGYAPYSYTKDVWTKDIEEVIARVNNLGAEGMVSYILDRLTNKTLTSELYEVGVTWGIPK